MDKIFNENKKELIQNKPVSLLEKIQSEYFLKIIFLNLSKKKLLFTVKYNKRLQNHLNINKGDYIKFCEEYTPIEIELIPSEGKSGKFINMILKKSYYHIYFNDSQEEIKKNYLDENDKVKKIRIILDFHINMFNLLFRDCKIIESISFKKFYRKNIIDMNSLFYGCLSLKQINFSSFNTNNVTSMNSMFCKCPSLKEFNLSTFNSDNVKDMGDMFCECSLLEGLNHLTLILIMLLI